LLQASEKVEPEGMELKKELVEAEQKKQANNDRKRLSIFA